MSSQITGIKSFEEQKYVILSEILLVKSGIVVLPSVFRLKERRSFSSISAGDKVFSSGIIHVFLFVAKIIKKQ